jgi:hypothetical protein
MMPGSTGLNRSATCGSWPATMSLAEPASLSIVSKAVSISGKFADSARGATRQRSKQPADLSWASLQPLAHPPVLNKNDHEHDPPHAHLGRKGGWRGV